MQGRFSPLQADTKRAHALRPTPPTNFQYCVSRKTRDTSFQLFLLNYQVLPKCSLSQLADSAEPDTEVTGEVWMGIFLELHKATELARQTLPQKYPMLRLSQLGEGGKGYKLSLPSLLFSPLSGRALPDKILGRSG